ncbi:MAG TPA: hypothetical protein VEM93_07680 [Actinomycetota bacterium]|nr:hypothetical protein [Actinomycetota bacterium]
MNALEQRQRELVERGELGPEDQNDDVGSLARMLARSEAERSTEAEASELLRWCRDAFSPHVLLAQMQWSSGAWEFDPDPASLKRHVWHLYREPT